MTTLEALRDAIQRYDGSEEGAQLVFQGQLLQHLVEAVRAFVAIPSLDIERLAIAINNGVPEGLDNPKEWYIDPHGLATDVARIYGAEPTEEERQHDPD